jgi:hypothetical protein
MDKATMLGLLFVVIGLVLIILQFTPNLRIKLGIFGFKRGSGYRGIIGGPMFIILGILMLTGVIQ